MYIHKQIKLVFFSLSNRKTGGGAATTLRPRNSSSFEIMGKANLSV